MKITTKKDINETNKKQLQQFLLNVKYVIIDSDLDGWTSWRILKSKNKNCKLIGLKHKTNFYVNEIPKDLNPDNTVFLDTIFPNFVSIDNHNHICEIPNFKGIAITTDYVWTKYCGSTTLLMTWLLDIELTEQNMERLLLSDGFINVCNKYIDNVRNWLPLFNQQKIIDFALKLDPKLVRIAKEEHDNKIPYELEKYPIIIAQRIKVKEGDFYYGIRYNNKSIFKNNFKIYKKEFQRD